MTTATLTSLHAGFSSRRHRSRAEAEREGWFTPVATPVFDAGDFCAVAFTFAFAAGLVLGGAVACDSYLVGLVRRGPLNDFAAYQLARDLLPWSVAFTAIAGGMAALGLKIACRLRKRSVSTGFLPRRV